MCLVKQGGWFLGLLLALTTWAQEPAQMTARPPKDLPPARQIRVGNQIGAAQLEDGSWRVWGNEEAEVLNEQVRALGPLKDLSVGAGYFVGIN